MNSQSAPETRTIQTALNRYRVMAWVTGICLIVLCANMVLKYVFKIDYSLNWIGLVHGTAYILYLFFTVDLAIKVRWPLWTTVGTLLAGTIPLLGIILEHSRTQQVREQFNLQAPATQAPTEPAPDRGVTERPSHPG